MDLMSYMSADGDIIFNKIQKFKEPGKPLVTIVTVVFNGQDTLEKTILSVINQTYSNIEYIVIDGASTDGTVDVIKKYEIHIDYWISEPDSGMYDALTKGFLAAKGDIVCYINSGDFLYPHALGVVVDVFENTNCSWITGYRSVCNDDGVVTRVDLPFRYKKSLIQVGVYGVDLPFIQQESTFWRASLISSVDLGFFRKLKLAGDYYLWWSFSKQAELEIVSSPLGVFKVHPGQLSESMFEYFLEVNSFVKKKRILDKINVAFELIFWAMHVKLRELFIKTVFVFDHKSKKWEK